MRSRNQRLRAPVATIALTADPQLKLPLLLPLPIITSPSALRKLSFLRFPLSSHLYTFIWHVRPSTSVFHLAAEACLFANVVLTVHLARLDRRHQLDGVGALRHRLFIQFELLQVLDEVHLGGALLKHVLERRQADTSKLAPPLEVQICLEQTSTVLVGCVFAVGDRGLAQKAIDLVVALGVPLVRALLGLLPEGGLASRQRLHLGWLARTAPDRPESLVVEVDLERVGPIVSSWHLRCGLVRPPRRLGHAPQVNFHWCLFGFVQQVEERRTHLHVGSSEQSGRFKRRFRAGCMLH